MEIKLTNKDIIWSYIGTIVSMGSNLLMLPFIVYYLDADMLGMWYVFASLGSVATLFDFGFSVTFARNITYCWSGANQLKKTDVVYVQNSEPDFHLMKSILTSCKVIYLMISSLAFLLLISIGTIYIRYVAHDITGSEYLIAWFIYSIAIFLNLYYGYFASFLRGVGAVDAANKNTVIARMAQIAATVILLASGMGIIGASIAYLVYGALFRIMGKYKFYHYQEIGNNLANIKDKVTQKEIRMMFSTIWHNAWRDGAISFSDYLCNQASTLICSTYLSLSETGVYSIGVQIATAIAQISGTLYTAYQPTLQSAYIHADWRKMRKTMSIIVDTFIVLFVLGTLGFSVLGLPLLRIVKPEAVVSMPVFWGLCLYQFILKFRNCYTSYFSCTNRILYLNGFLTSAFLCIALSFAAIGILKMGVWGLIAAQIVSQLIYNAWHWPYKAHRELKLSVKEMLNWGIQELLLLLKKI